MLSSAVVIPEQTEIQQPTPPAAPSLKRRQSSQSPDSHKRARLESNGTESPAIPLSTSPSSRRKSSALNGAAEEKKRGQRLFGALLGTLSQTSGKSAHKKRDEIDARQRERLRKDTEEQEEQRRRKRLELDAVRRVEQKAWDEEGQMLRHRNRRAMAEFLLTEAEPRLYYRPWDLREKEEEIIKRQKREVEEDITGEVVSIAAKTMAETGMDREMDDPPILEDVKPPEPLMDGDKMEEDSIPPRMEDDSVKEQDESSNPLSQKQEDDVPTPSSLVEDEARPKTGDGSKQKDDDHGGEELVEGQEDDVIY